MTNPLMTKYDVVIVGAGVAGAIVAYELGRKGKSVLVLEAGPADPPNRAAYMEQFYLANAKVPESPYPPDPAKPNPAGLNAPRPTTLDLQWPGDATKSYLIQNPTGTGGTPFASTYERLAGGTMWHWLGTSLRLLETDFTMKSTYEVGEDWPVAYTDLLPFYARAEQELGVSGDPADLDYLDPHRPTGFPMPGILKSLVDQAVAGAVDGKTLFGRPLKVSTTTAARNSQPFDERRTCAGNTNCIPICPVQAKFDATVLLNKALETGNVTLLAQAVASRVLVDGVTGRISGIEYITYNEPDGPGTVQEPAIGDVYVLAAHAIETPKLLLNSYSNALPKGVANGSDQVGRNLMDHPLYLSWAMAPTPVWGMRGPLSTSGIETLRDGPFRHERAAFRIEIGNEGWNFPGSDPYTTVQDLIDGTNKNGLNPDRVKLFGQSLIQAMNDRLTRQFRMACLVEQLGDPSNRITLSDQHTDHLGLRRPVVHYRLDDYTRRGFLAAKEASSRIYAWMGAKEYTATDPKSPTTFTVEDGLGDTAEFNYYGAGHIMGTCRMGNSKATSVVNADQRSWEHDNLYIVGSSVFPTSATGNPTLTIAATTFRVAGIIGQRLGVAP
ncbi:GMC family oxidoreductase [Azospirillum sp. sgz302134]